MKRMFSKSDPIPFAFGDGGQIVLYLLSSLVTQVKLPCSFRLSYVIENTPACCFEDTDSFHFPAVLTLLLSMSLSAKCLLLTCYEISQTDVHMEHILN